MRCALIGAIRDLSSRTILLTGFAIFIVYAFPGYMSTDSVQQLVEARTGHFSDGSPPLMAAEWWILDRIVGGPILMLLLQGTLFLSGLYALLRTQLAARHAAWTGIAVFLFPPVLVVMSVIWKDSQMAAFLMGGLAALQHPRLRIRLVGLALLAAACALRWNAAAAVVPLVVILFEWRRGMGGWKRLSVLAVAGGLTVALAFGATRMLTSQHVKITPVFTDIMDVIACGKKSSDEELRDVLRGTRLAVSSGIQAHAQKLHEMHGVWRVVSGDQPLFRYPNNDAEWNAFYRAWRELVLGQPGAYLRCHWDDFARLIGLDDDVPHAAVWNLFLEDAEQMKGIDHIATWSGFQDWIAWQLYWLAEHTFLFHGSFYGLLSLLLLVSCCRDRLTLALLTSGLLYELSYFPIGAEPDSRYSHWMTTVTCVATVILFVQRKRASSQPAAVDPTG